MSRWDRKVCSAVKPLGCWHEASLCVSFSFCVFVDFQAFARSVSRERRAGTGSSHDALGVKPMQNKTTTASGFNRRENDGLRSMTLVKNSCTDGPQKPSDSTTQQSDGHHEGGIT